MVDGLSEATRHFDGDLGVAAHGSGRTQSEREDDETVLHFEELCVIRHRENEPDLESGWSLDPCFSNIGLILATSSSE